MLDIKERVDGLFVYSFTIRKVPGSAPFAYRALPDLDSEKPDSDIILSQDDWNRNPEDAENSSNNGGNFSQRAFDDERTVAEPTYSRLAREVEAYKGDKIAASGQ